MEQEKPAYITIVEGPPPDFRDVSNEWSIGVLEGTKNSNIFLCEMRAFDGPKLVERCYSAWCAGRPARLDFPTGAGSRKELDIVAARWEKVEEGHKLYLWVKMDKSE
jgi:hypothetical protein